MARFLSRDHSEEDCKSCEISKSGTGGRPSNIERSLGARLQWLHVTSEIIKCAGPGVAPHLCFVGEDDGRLVRSHASCLIAASSSQPPGSNRQITNADGNGLFPHRRYSMLGLERIINALTTGALWSSARTHFYINTNPPMTIVILGNRGHEAHVGALKKLAK